MHADRIAVHCAPMSEPSLIGDAARVRAIAGEVAAAGAFAFDVEFVSEGRCIPELALLQLAWGDPEAPETALIDCLAVDPAPLVELVSDPAVETIAHAARQDLGLLRFRFGARAAGFLDTQIAAAFVGLGEQIGYGRLVEGVLGVPIDKGSQFTAWLSRPLTPRQLAYARADVLHLPALWRELRRRLVDAGRLEWVAEESQRLVSQAEPLPDEDEAWREVGGARALDPAGRGALRALAAWRQRTAIADNRPLGWIMPDKAMLELARRRGGDPARVKGVPEPVARRHGAAIAAALRDGAARPIEEVDERPPALSARGQTWVGVINALVQSIGVESGIAGRFLGTRAEVEALVAWVEGGGDPDAAPSLLRGWRRQLVGGAALAWLRGEAAIAVGDGAAAVRLVAGGDPGSGLQLRR